MKNFSLGIFLIFFLFFLFTSPSFASAPQIIAFPSGTINLDQSFTLSATMSGLSKNAVYRLRIAIAQPGTTNYFGSTWNGSSWYNGTPAPISYAYFLSITTDSNGSWSGNIQGKIDPDDPNFTTGSGIYDLKVGRYTQTGSSATWSDAAAMTIFAPDPTPLPPAPTATPIPTPTATPKPPTPTPFLGKTPIPTRQPTYKISPVLSASDSAKDDMVGSESGGFIATPSPTIRIARSFTKKPPVIFLLLGSIIVLAAAGISGWFVYKQKYNGEAPDNNSE